MSNNFLINTVCLIVCGIAWIKRPTLRALVCLFLILSALGSVYDLVFKFWPAHNHSGILAAAFWIGLGIYGARWLYKEDDHLFLCIFALTLLLGMTDKSHAFVADIETETLHYGPTQEKYNENRPWWHWAHQHLYQPLWSKYILRRIEIPRIGHGTPPEEDD